MYDDFSTLEIWTGVYTNSIYSLLSFQRAVGKPPFETFSNLNPFFSLIHFIRSQRYTILPKISTNV